MATNLEVITGDIWGVKNSFESVLSDNSIKFEREAGFAIQILTKNDYAMKIAMGNRQSVVDAVTNLAAIGISLNPARKLAYLVPRKSEICLDISYLGLLDIAIESGSIKWGQCKIVRKNDLFKLHKLDELPTHEYEPFEKKDVRGEIIGVYVVVKTKDNDYLTHTMDIDSVYDIRARSESFKSGKNSPWLSDPEEMIKKTCIKQGYKMWPKTERLDQAIHYLNTDGGEGIQMQEEKDVTPPVKPKLQDKFIPKAIAGILAGKYDLQSILDKYELNANQLQMFTDALPKPAEAEDVSYTPE